MKQRCHHIVFCLFLCFAIGMGSSTAQNTYEDKQIKVFLRKIGHEVLLYSGDSTSRVLPIIKEDTHHKIPFESEFAISPDSLVKIVRRVVADTEITNNFILEVESCETRDIVYSFEIDHEKQSDIIACSSRLLPKDCYNFLCSILDKNTEQEITPAAVSTSSTSKTGYYVLAGVLFALLTGSLIYYQRKKQHDSQSNSNLIPLGEYRFDTLNTELHIEQQRIELTSKEAELLLLLYDAANTTVEREVILNMVWGDKGDYVGRTLDVFISKLRKKLEFDSKVKIVNIRGIGYKLVLDV